MCKATVKQFTIPCVGQVLFHELDVDTLLREVEDNSPQVIQVSGQPIHEMNHKQITDGKVPLTPSKSKQAAQLLRRAANSVIIERADTLLRHSDWRFDSRQLRTEKVKLYRFE